MTSTLFPHHFRRLGWILLIPGLALGSALIITDQSADFLNFSIPVFPWSSDLGSMLQSPEENPAFLSWRAENFSNELTGLLILCGAMFVAFSREKMEDEYLVHLRLNAMLWAVYINAALTVFALLFLYGFTFLYFMMGHLFLFLILFIARYHWQLRKMKVEAIAE